MSEEFTEESAVDESEEDEEVVDEDESLEEDEKGINYGRQNR